MKRIFFIFLLFFLSACQSNPSLSLEPLSIGKDPILPPPNIAIIPTVNIASASKWPQGEKPKVHKGFVVNLFSKEVSHPRWLFVLPNGDVLVAQSNKQPSKKIKGLKDLVAGFVMKKAGAGVDSPDKITLLRDSDGDGYAELAKDFLTGLHSPFGMALIGEYLYVADTDAIWRYHYEPGNTFINTQKFPPTKIIDLPEGDINYHWTKNIIASLDNSKLYITVGSNSNIGENGIDSEKNRATILELDLKTNQLKIFASGLRNPNGLAWNPDKHELWTVVNERDELGNDLVPDYLTSVNEGDHFGWPYYYFGDHKDPRINEPQPYISKIKKPDYALGAHVAALGLLFANHLTFPPPFNEGVFISEHGSWNRKPRSGYKVVFIPFKNGEPQGMPIEFLTEFVVNDEAFGRPVGLAADSKGNLLIADDVGNSIWRVRSDH